MKKIITIILIVACLAGIGVLGYVIFRSKNIESVAIEGQMQSLYFVNETTTPNFDDAKLVVTYKNGNIKKLDITSKNVKVDDFSTSLKSHGTMKITYKSQTVEKDYDVIESGLYYISKEAEKTADTSYNPSSTPDIALNEANIMFYLSSDGVLQYYSRKFSGNYWCLNDGAYDENYYYEIKGDTLVVNFLKANGDKDSYNIKANYDDNGELTLTSTSTLPGSTSESYPRGELIKTFTCANKYYKTNVSIDSISPSTISGVDATYRDQKYYFNFKLGTSFDKYDIYISVTFHSPIIYYPDNTPLIQQQQVFVKVTEEMIRGLHLEYVHGDDHAEIYYNDKMCNLYYVVE